MRTKLPSQEDLARFAQAMRSVADRIERGESALCASDTQVETYQRDGRTITIECLTLKFMRREDIDA